MSPPISIDVIPFSRDKTLIRKTIFKHKQKVIRVISNQKIPNSEFVKRSSFKTIFLHESIKTKV